MTLFGHQSQGMRRASTGNSAVGDLHAQLRERAQVFDCLRYPLAPLPEVESGLHSRRRSVNRLKVSNRYSGDGGTCMSPVTKAFVCHGPLPRPRLTGGSRLRRVALQPMKTESSTVDECWRLLR